MISKELLSVGGKLIAQVKKLEPGRTIKITSPRTIWEPGQDILTINYLVELCKAFDLNTLMFIWPPAEEVKRFGETLPISVSRIENSRVLTVNGKKK